jgi:SAM-dependent methyltransferase
MVAIEIMGEEADELVHDALIHVLINQAHYAEKFIETATFLDSHSFYTKVVNFIDLRNERVVLDIGCGDCRVIREIKEVRPSTTIIGVDINPLLLKSGEKELLKLGYKVNIHHGVNIAMDPETHRLTLISDLLYNDNASWEMKRAVINLIQEDMRFAEVTQNGISNLGGVDVITYTLAGGFSPHIELEHGTNNADSVIKAGIELNNAVAEFGVVKLKPGGRMIWAQRAAAGNINTLRAMDLDDLHISGFKPYFNVGKVEVLEIDENKSGLGLTLPAFTISDNVVHYNDDVRKMKNYDFKGVIVLIELVRTPTRRY